MKKQTHKQWLHTVQITLRSRNRRDQETHRHRHARARNNDAKKIEWIDRWRSRGVQLVETKSAKLIVQLPPIMNFSTHYEETASHILAIRSLAKNISRTSGTARLARVDFSHLTRISTSAALVLTAELSKWEDRIQRRLRPMTEQWNDNILRQFQELGFFDLFERSPDNLRVVPVCSSSQLRLVRYIKGRCGEAEKARALRTGIAKLVGEDIEKWAFLRGGLDEAVTNVTHHAYPTDKGYTDSDKYWYLTGSYNPASRQIKIVFYDQGVGIPASLPASELWERVLSSLSVLPVIERRRDAAMIKAAMELDRTRTGESDRGKGLQDLLEFVRQRGAGYLSVLSGKGLYKHSIDGGEVKVKSEHFENAIRGTLIIWSATLNSGLA